MAIPTHVVYPPKDILRRLRDPDPNWKEDEIGDLILDAADEIERLRNAIGKIYEVANETR